MTSDAVWLSGTVAAIVSVIGTSLMARFLTKPYEANMAAHLTHLESELQDEREERKALRSRIDIQEQTRFTALRTMRAEAISLTASLSGIPLVDSTFSGLVLGTAYLLTGRNLWAPILAHGIKDTVAVIFFAMGWAN